MSHTAIIILNWNGKAYLQQFLPQLVEHSRLPGVELVVADNGSTDGSVAFLKTAFPSVRLLVYDRNYGFTGGYNRAIAETEADYILLLNSDVEVTEGWLQPMIRMMDEDP